MKKVVLFFVFALFSEASLAKEALIYMIPKNEDGSLGGVQVLPVSKVSFPLPENIELYWFDVDSQADLIQPHKDTVQALYSEKKPELFSYPKSEVDLGDTLVKGIYIQPRVEFSLEEIAVQPSFDFSP